MPLKLDIKKLLSARSDRVKSVDFHPTEPWVLAGLYSGTIMIWDYNTQALVRQMEVSNLPIRTAKFVVRRQWIVVGCDDMTVKILNYNTLERIKSLEGHSDYIRHIAVHPTLPLILTSSDDMTIREWDWDKNWECTRTYEGHSHYVMMVQWNPKDNTSFASASLDRSIKVWGISGGTNAHFTLTGHARGVNCIDYAQSGEKPYLVSGSDDKTVRVWDYQTKQCVHVLEGHTGNVSSVVFHPTLPVILTGSEDGVCKLWHSTTYRLETSLNYMQERLWSIGVMKGSNTVALGYDEGTVVIKLGSDDPVVSYNAGKIIWAKGVDIQTVNLKQLDDSTAHELVDGEIVPNIPVKDMGSCELFPQSLSHHPSGRLFSVCGDGEYVIYTSQVLRNKSFGHALGFAWCPEGHYATRDNANKITVYHNFKEAFSFKPDFHIEEIHSGQLLGVRGSDFIVFYDWNEYRVIRRIDVVCRSVYWSDAGEYVALASIDSLFVLAHDKSAVQAAVAGGYPSDDGIEIAFDLVNEVQESVQSGVWISEACFAFINEKMKLNTLVGGQVEVIAHLDHPLLLLGYMQEHSRLYCIDKQLNLYPFEIQLNLIRYKSAVVSGDVATAETLFAEIPVSQHTKIARFLENQGYRAEALEITKDPEHKFELAVQVGKLDMADKLLHEMEVAAAKRAGADDQSSLRTKRRMMGDKALETGQLDLAQKCFIQAEDANSLLLLGSCSGDIGVVEKAAEIAHREGQTNVEFTARFIMGDVRGCVNVLARSPDRLGEAVLFARTYCPSALHDLLPAWKKEVGKINPQIAACVADPTHHPEMFPGFSESLVAEKVMSSLSHAPAKNFKSVKTIETMDLVGEVKQSGESGLKQKLEKLVGTGGIVRPVHSAPKSPVVAAPIQPAVPKVVLPQSVASPIDAFSPKSSRDQSPQTKSPKQQSSPKSRDVSPKMAAVGGEPSPRVSVDSASPRVAPPGPPGPPPTRSMPPGPPTRTMPPGPPTRTMPPGPPSRPGGPPSIPARPSTLPGPPSTAPKAPANKWDANDDDLL